MTGPRAEGGAGGIGSGAALSMSAGNTGRMRVRMVAWVEGYKKWEKESVRVHASPEEAQHS